MRIFVHSGSGWSFSYNTILRAFFFFAFLYPNSLRVSVLQELLLSNLRRLAPLVTGSRD